MRQVVTAALLLALPLAAASGQSKVGTTAANFLTIPVGPRAAAMGGAFVAIANDGTDLYWNVAGISRLSGNECVAVHSPWLAGTNLNWLGLVIRLDGDDAIGLSVNQLEYGKEEITTADQPNGTGQDWDAQDIAVGLSYARNLTDRFSVGGTVKFVHQRIWNESASAFGCDVDLLFTTPYHGITIGMSIANFGTEMQLDGKDLYQPVDIDPGHAGNNANIVGTLETKSWPLPLLFTVGVGCPVASGDDFRWVIGLDAVYPNSQTPFVNSGTELIWRDLLALRAGYSSLFKEANEEGFTGGVGVRLSLGSVVTCADYSYSVFGVFGGISRFAVSVQF